MKKISANSNMQWESDAPGPDTQPGVQEGTVHRLTCRAGIKAELSGLSIKFLAPDPGLFSLLLANFCLYVLYEVSLDWRILALIGVPIWGNRNTFFSWLKLLIDSHWLHIMNNYDEFNSIHFYTECLLCAMSFMA